MKYPERSQEVAVIFEWGQACQYLLRVNSFRQHWLSSQDALVVQSWGRH